MVPGYCRAKVHQLDTLGIGGRRVLVSRDWSGKTLKDHKWDQVLWVRRLLAVSLGHEAPVDDATAAKIDAAREGGAPAPIAWELANPRDPDVDALYLRLMRAIATQNLYRQQREEAKERDAARAAHPPGSVSATGGDHDRPD
jgi:hypothetical protein